MKPKRCVVICVPKAAGHRDIVRQASESLVTAHGLTCVLAGNVQVHGDDGKAAGSSAGESSANESDGEDYRFKDNEVWMGRYVINDVIGKVRTRAGPRACPVGGDGMGATGQI
jgi:hypothetical protein